MPPVIDDGEDVNLEFMIMHASLETVLAFVVARDDVRRISGSLEERIEAEGIADEHPTSSTLRAFGHVSVAA